MFCIIDCYFGYLCFGYCLKNKSIMIRIVAPFKSKIFIENYTYVNLKNSKEIFKKNILYSYTKN